MVIGVWVLTGVIIGISYGVHRHQRDYYGISGYCKSIQFLEESMK